MKEFDLSLYLVTDRRTFDNTPLIDVVEKAIIGGVTIVQLREKRVLTAEIIMLGKKLHEVTRHYGVPLIINDNIIAALAIGAEGVHVGQSDQIAFSAREMIGLNKILGVSAGTVQEAIRAQNDGADYLGVGSVFTTTTKKDAGHAIGLEMMRKISQSVHIPIVGIGGITKENASSVINAGAAGVAVVSAIIGAKDPKQAAKDLRNSI